MTRQFIKSFHILKVKMSVYHMPFLSMNHFFFLCLYLNYPNHQMYKMAVHPSQLRKLYRWRQRSFAAIHRLISPKTKTLCFSLVYKVFLEFLSTFALLDTQNSYKKINQALKLHFTVVEVLTLANPNITNSQWQHTLNYHLKNKNMTTFLFRVE